MNRLAYFFATLFLLLFTGCNGRKESRSATTCDTDSIVSSPEDTLLTADDTFIADTGFTSEELRLESELAIAPVSYEDSLREAALNDIFWHKKLYPNDFGTFYAKADSVMIDYLNYRQETLLQVDTLYSPLYTKLQADTFRINEKRRFLETHLLSTSDMVLISNINTEDNLCLRSDYIGFMANMELPAKLDMAITKELELWENLVEHEIASSENILLGEYLTGDTNEVLQAGILSDNSLIWRNSIASLYLAISEQPVPELKVRNVQDSIYLTRKEIWRAYRKIKPFISENDGLVLEEEESIFNAMIDQRLKIIAMLPKKSHAMMKRDLLLILQNKFDHLDFYRNTLTPSLAGIDEEALND
ncbi:MAG: hypothetical protein RR202_07400 [Bacteroidales bacterium]